MSSVVASSALNIPLLRLQRILTPAEHQDFQFATLDDLHRTIEVIQQQQVKNKKLQCFVKIKPFLETMKQYGQVIEVFLNTTNLLAFVWGPMKFILQTVSTVADVLEEILDTYQDLGECLPQFQQYEALFRNNSYLQRVLEYIYEDILDFHRKALKVFRHRAWYLLFQCTWKGLASSIRSVRANLQRHKTLVETQATLAHFEEAQEARERAKDAVLRAEEAEKRRMMITVTEWLAPPDSKSDQQRYSKIREEYPNTGRWLLKARKMKKWLDNLNTEIPLLWLYGIPGAGKSVLASLIVEELEKLKTSTSTATGQDQLSTVFFYCKHGNQNKNNYLAVMRGLISQLLKQSPETIPLLYNDITLSGEIALMSQQDAERLLKKTLDGTSATTMYIIIDGLDECDTTDMIYIVRTLTTAAESLNGATPATCRLFFTSRNERAISRALSKAERLQIRLKDNEADMKKFTELWSVKIQVKFALTDFKRQELEANILSRADGMFLFCVLVLQNLLGLTTREELNRELEPDTFPRGLEDAYARIVERIKRDSTPSQQQAAFKILGLLACCRRPLKKREIQGYFSINIDGTVDFDNRCLRDDIKELCGSLVEVCGDIVEFVHRTVKHYLVEGKLLDLLTTEMDLAITCVRYLSTPCYDRLIGETQIQHFTSLGYYAFLDYAAVHWINHVRSCVAAMTTATQAHAVIPLIPLLQTFLDLHWDHTQVLVPASSQSAMCKKDLVILETCSPETFHKLVHLSSRAVRPLAETPYITSSSRTLASTNLGVVIHRIRTTVEGMYAAATTGLAKDKLETYYGTHCFKCTEEDCAYFSEGFSSRQARDEHQKRHTRFLCSEPGCYKSTVGCSTEQALKVHMEEDHELGSKVTSSRIRSCRLKFPAVRNNAGGSAAPPPSFQSSSKVLEVLGTNMTREDRNLDTTDVDYASEFNNALSYVDQVKEQYVSQPEIYREFLSIMRDFQGKLISTPSLMERISSLFSENPSLIRGFNDFLRFFSSS